MTQKTGESGDRPTEAQVMAQQTQQAQAGKQAQQAQAGKQAGCMTRLLHMVNWMVSPFECIARAIKSWFFSLLNLREEKGKKEVQPEACARTEGEEIHTETKNTLPKFAPRKGRHPAIQQTEKTHIHAEMQKGGGDVPQVPSRRLGRGHVPHTESTTEEREGLPPAQWILSKEQPAVKTATSGGISGVHTLDGEDEFATKLKGCGAEGLIRTIPDGNCFYYAAGTGDYTRGQQIGHQWDIQSKGCGEYVKQFAKDAQEMTTTALRKLISKMTPEDVRGVLGQADTGAGEGTMLEVQVADTGGNSHKVVMSCRMLLEQILLIDQELGHGNVNMQGPISEMLGGDIDEEAYQDQFRHYAQTENINGLCKTFRGASKREKLGVAIQWTEDVTKARDSVRKVWWNPRFEQMPTLSDLQKSGEVEGDFLEQDPPTIVDILRSKMVPPMPTNLPDSLSRILWCEKRFECLSAILTSKLLENKVNPEKFFPTVGLLLQTETAVMEEIMKEAGDSKFLIRQIIIDVCRQHGFEMERAVNSLRKWPAQIILDSLEQKEWKDCLKMCVEQREHLISRSEAELAVFPQITGREVYCLVRRNGARYAWYKYAKDGRKVYADDDDQRMGMMEQQAADEGGFLCQYRAGIHFDYAATKEELNIYAQSENALQPGRFDVAQIVGGGSSSKQK